jgi:hypothetical protein
LQYVSVGFVGKQFHDEEKRPELKYKKNATTDVYEICLNQENITSSGCDSSGPHFAAGLVVFLLLLCS